jgi:hypothetical protein
MRMWGRAATVFAASVTLAGGLMGGTASADVGGNGNPYNDCPNGQTIASANIYQNGSVIGLVELRWSWACSGNWTRTTSYIGAKTLISEVWKDPSGGYAMGDDYATQNWSPYVVVSPSQRMCFNGVIRVSSNQQYAAGGCSN